MRQIFAAILFIVLGLGFLIPDNSQALTIGPPTFELSADPGDILTGAIRLRNEQDQTMTFYSSSETFTLRGASQSPTFSGKKEDLAAWIEITPSVTLSPGERKEIPFSIRVPEAASPGGHYAAIFWSSAPPEGTGGGVGIVSRLAVLVYLTVSGDVVESAEVSDFRTAKKVFGGLPVNFSLSFKNTGTIYLKPEGEIAIKNIFGKTVATLPTSVEGREIIFPDTRVNLTAVWEKEGFKIGYYRAVLNLQFGKEGTVQAKTGFWIMPWKTLLAGIIILALLFWGITKGIKLYNRWVISKARGGRF